MRADHEPTRATLLRRVKDPADQKAWTEFNARYRELIVRFCRARGLQVSDAEDVAQGVLTKLVTGLRRFEYDPAAGRFRQYLFRCIRSRLADFWSCQAATGMVVDTVESIDGAEPGVEADAQSLFEWEWIGHHYRMALAEFRETSDQRTKDLLDATLRGRSGSQIGDEIGMSASTVHKAQQRIRERLRDIIARQIREEDSDG